MTARANGLQPFEYLSYLFEYLPCAMTLEAIEALLPWNVKATLDALRTRPIWEDRVFPVRVHKAA